GPGGEQREDDPWPGDRHAGAVDRPALPRLQLAAGRGVLAPEAAEGPQEAARVLSAYSAGQPQGLDDAVGHGVGEAFLERVERVAEPAAGAVVVGEAAERFAPRGGGAA